MKVKIGNDIVDIKKFEASLKKPKFMENVFLPSETKNSNVEHLAGIFTAKESVIKALGCKPGLWLKIEISNDPSGKPIAKLSKDLTKNKVLDYDMSISHDGQYAIASFVVLINDSKKR